MQAMRSQSQVVEYGDKVYSHFYTVFTLRLCVKLIV